MSAASAPGVRPLLHREHMSRQRDQRESHRRHVERLRGPQRQNGRTIRERVKTRESDR
ncbi:MAG: hypothetical protein ACJ8CR_35520 [Roseiflexaceae bacterium]